jgi:hypothetical protein
VLSRLSGRPEAAHLILFSCLFAARSVVLEEAQPTAWPPILVETPADNVGAKVW